MHRSLLLLERVSKQYLSFLLVTRTSKNAQGSEVRLGGSKEGPQGFVEEVTFGWERLRAM
jgi:hypothetical protein